MRAKLTPQAETKARPGESARARTKGRRVSQSSSPLSLLYSETEYVLGKREKGKMLQRTDLNLQTEADTAS